MGGLELSDYSRVKIQVVKFFVPYIYSITSTLYGNMNNVVRKYKVSPNLYSWKNHSSFFQNLMFRRIKIILICCRQIVG